MKRLIFLIWLLINSPLWANTKTVVIGDSTYFNYTHTTAIDSAQLILIRGTVKDTLSLMPITGSSHKICDWEGIFNQVDSAGNYNVWIEPYSSGAIADTILGDCQVELDSVLVDGSALAATAGAISDATMAASAINEIAGYPKYIYKMVVRGSPTTQYFEVSYISPSPTHEANDIFNGLLVMPITGNATKQVVKVADFTIADSNFTVRPGFTTSTNSGDTVLVFPARGGIESSTLTSDALMISATGRVRVDSVETGVYATVDTNSAGDSIAIQPEYWVAADTAAYQGPGGTLDTTKIKTMMNNNVWGSGYIWDYDLTGWDDSTAEEAGQFQTNIGIDNISHGIPTLHMKFGDYSGATGSNIEDEFDTLGLYIGGRGENACSIYVKSGAVYPANMSVVMFASGGTPYWGLTDANGMALFLLDDGTYTALLASAPTYTQDTIPQTFTFTAAYNDTITATATSIGAAGGGANFCSVYVYTYDILGDSIQGAVFTITPRGKGPWIDTNNVAIIPFTQRTTTNVNGYAGLAVYRSSVVRQLQPDGTAGGDSLKYDIQLTYKSKKWKADNRIVPNAGSWGAK